MATFPFELSIQCAAADGQAEQVICNKHLRVIPRNREVFDAIWKGKSIVLKVFTGKARASRRLKREWQGLLRLRERGVPAPRPLFYGRTQDGRLAIAIEKISNCPTLRDLFAAADKDQKIDLLLKLARQLALQHQKGIKQEDLHLDNFMLAGDRIYVLDPGQIRFSPGPLDRKKSTSQLALLARYLPAEDNRAISRLCREYFAQRGWNLEEGDEQNIHRYIELHTRRTIRRTLRKCLRTSKRQLRIRTGPYLAVFKREFCATADPGQLIKQIDDLMGKGQILKNGNTCFISRLTWNSRDVVIKRYNHKGIFHSLRHTIKRSRARHGWLHAHRLEVLDIPTPKPMAYIELRRGPLVWTSYLLTEYVEGRKLYYYLRDNKISQAERLAATKRILQLIAKLGKYGITHGDLKPSNILITQNGPVLTDLDSMQAHKSRWFCKLRWAADAASIDRLNEQFVHTE